MAPITSYVLTSHAVDEIHRRGLDADLIGAVLRSPGQRLSVGQSRDIVQSRVVLDGKEYLVRVVVDVDRNPAEVVTAYRTSNVGKYWRIDT